MVRHITYVGFGRNGRHVQHLLRKTPSVGRGIVLLRTFLRFHSCHHRLLGDNAGQADRFKRFIQHTDNGAEMFTYIRPALRISSGNSMTTRLMVSYDRNCVIYSILIP